MLVILLSPDPLKNAFLFFFFFFQTDGYFNLPSELSQLSPFWTSFQNKEKLFQCKEGKLYSLLNCVLMSLLKTVIAFHMASLTCR